MVVIRGGPSGAAGSAANPVTSVQFNSGGSFAGSANLVWTGTSLDVLGAMTSNGSVYSTGQLYVFYQDANNNAYFTFTGGSMQFHIKISGVDTVVQEW